MIFAEIGNSYLTKPDIPPAFSAISGISSKGIKMDAEQWKPVVGWEGLYEVSNLGRVKSVRKKMILRPRIVGAGYLQVVPQRNGNRVTRYVHVMVAEAWCDRPPGTTEVNHDNLNKADCRAKNLIWTTRLGNMRHAAARRGGTPWMKGNLFALGIGGRHPTTKTRKQHRDHTRELYRAMALSETQPPSK